ncbi:MAG: YafY family transcriptional regulator [Parvularculaceae bacterium]|nr:YafY family transcriptional regulator [Parvularculaceae bacterium]
MRRTDRLFELIQLFRSGRLWRGQDLADALGVSLRTLYRDIDSLTASGLPIEGERGVGYILREPIFLPPMTMSHPEVEALQLGMRMVSRLGDPDLAKAAQSLLVKIEAVLPSDRRDQDFSDHIALTAAMPEGVHQTLPILRQALRERRSLELRYRNAEGDESARLVHPLSLEYWGQVWTLTSWCTLRDDFRVFRADRIEQAILRECFQLRPKQSYEAYIQSLEEKTPQP